MTEKFLLYEYDTDPDGTGKKNRIPYLLGTPAAKRVVSCEPLLGEVDLSEYLARLHWVLCGGESGHNARPMHPRWVRSLRDQCDDAGTAYWFKQWGEWMPITQIGTWNPEKYFYNIGGYSVAPQYYDAFVQASKRNQWGCLDIHGEYNSLTTTWNGRDGNADDDYEVSVYRLGRKATGDILDGQQWHQVPERGSNA